MAKELKYAKLTSDLILTSKTPGTEIPDKYISELLFEKLTEHTDKTLFIDGPTGEKMTGAEIRETASRIALSLTDHGIKEGDVVFGYSFNNSHYACAVIACPLIGAVFTGCMHTHPIRDLDFQLKDAGGKVLLCSSQNLDVALQACENNDQVILVVLLDVETVPASGRQTKVKVVSIHDLAKRETRSGDIKLPVIPLSKPPSEAVAFSMYSSGTTGNPKGVLKSHKNTIALCVSPEPGLGFTSAMGTPCTITCHSPMPHTSGTMTVIAAVYGGTTLVFNDGFKPETFLSSIEKYGVNYAYLAPAYIVILSKLGHEVEKYDISSLEYVVTGGSPLLQSVVDDFYSVMKISRLWQVYGMTESGLVTGVDADVKSTATVGRPQRNVQLKFVDRESGKALGPNEVGEIYIKGPENTIGYYNRPDADAENFSSDGYIKSGDAGYFDDDGLTFIVDRYKELIKYDTCQVAPSELESILLSHESVAEAAVVGMPDEVHGEIPKAFVVLKNEADVSEDELLAHVNDQVADIKRIRGGIVFVEVLPKIGLGKVDRVTLKRMSLVKT